MIYCPQLREGRLTVRLLLLRLITTLTLDVPGEPLAGQNVFFVVG